MNNPITLNVGGKLYTSTLATLTCYPDSMLGVMFSGKFPSTSDQHGNFFIDRDGKIFRYILNFLRSSNLDLPDDFQEIDLLKREADFYQIRPLIEALEDRESENAKSERNAMFNISLDQRMQTVYFTVKPAPQMYNLTSCSTEIFDANIFCTSAEFLKHLSSKFCYYVNGKLSPVGYEKKDPHHLTLQWVGHVRVLPEDEYTRQNLKRLWIVHTNEQVNNFQFFVEEVLKIAMSNGFHVDSLQPDSTDFMNYKLLRLVRYK